MGTPNTRILRLLPVLMLVTGCEAKPDPAPATPVTPVVPTRHQAPQSAPPAPPLTTSSYVEAAKAAMAAQDPALRYEPLPAPSSDMHARMAAALAAQEGSASAPAGPPPIVSSQARETWSRAFPQPTAPNLVPLERNRLSSDQFAELSRLYQRGQVQVKDLPPELRPLAGNCPELSTLAIKVVGEIAGEVADGTKADLPIQLLSGAAEIAFDHNKEEICGFLIGRLE